jgi:DNA (cytosine-5)-methyltransferase 1
MGYYRAGFEVVGVDINPQPNYPFEFRQTEALTVLGHLVDCLPLCDLFGWIGLRRFDAIHASPPCQHFSQMSLCRPGLQAEYPDLVDPVRQMLRATGLPYVIENVVGAPLENPVMICGSGLGMTLQRHRLFESNVALWGVPCAHGQNPWNPAYGHATGRKRRRVPVVGEWRIPKHLQEAAMGIDWMTLPELSEAIPPAYCEHIGLQLISHIEAVANA